MLQFLNLFFLETTRKEKEGLQECHWPNKFLVQGWNLLQSELTKRNQNTTSQLSYCTSCISCTHACIHLGLPLKTSRRLIPRTGAHALFPFVDKHALHSLGSVHFCRQRENLSLRIPKVRAHNTPPPSALCSSRQSKIHFEYPVESSPPPPSKRKRKRKKERLKARLKQ